MQRKNDSGVYENYYPNTVMSQVEGDIMMKAKVVVTARRGDNITVSGDTTLTVTITDSGTATIYLSYGNYTFINNSDNFTMKLNIDTVKTYEILVEAKLLNDYSWAEISAVSTSGDAANLFSVGDCKAITLNGTATILSLSSYSTCVYILDFNHDKSSSSGVADGITFGCFKTALSDGTDIAICTSLYGNYSSSINDFCMNFALPDTSSGGWQNSDMRYTVLGSTNTQNGNATSATATSPVSKTLMSCLPSDLRAIMRPMYIYTDNTGNGSDTASYVTGTLDYLPLLAEYEIQGTRTYANSAEQNHQTQYQYYKNGNSKIKYKHSDTSSLAFWWGRSVDSTRSQYFCGTKNTGMSGSVGARYSYGIAPMFKV